MIDRECRCVPALAWLVLYVSQRQLKVADREALKARVQVAT